MIPIFAGARRPWARALAVAAALMSGCDGAETMDDATTSAATEAMNATSAGSDDATSTAAGTSTVATATATSDDGTPLTGDATSTTASSTSGDATTGGGDSNDDTGALDTADDGGPPPECEALQDCCEQIGPDLYPGCSTVVQNGDAGLCDQILTTYHQDGYCTGETWCDDLAGCCGDLPAGPGWADTCWYYAELGNQPQCAMLIGDYQLSGYCF
jgi:hypothetical protein